MLASSHTQQARNLANSRRTWDKVEQYLTNVEKTRGLARAWELREQFEQGNITLGDMETRLNSRSFPMDRTIGRTKT